MHTTTTQRHPWLPGCVGNARRLKRWTLCRAIGLLLLLAGAAVVGFAAGVLSITR